MEFEIRKAGHGSSRWGEVEELEKIEDFSKIELDYLEELQEICLKTRVNAEIDFKNMVIVLLDNYYE